MGRSWSELALNRIITSEEARHLTRHERTLQDLRIRLHYQAGRREDRLLFDLQTPLANQFGLRDTPVKRASEQLMQIYYRTARAVTQINEIILQNLRVSIFPAQTAPAATGSMSASRRATNCWKRWTRRSTSASPTQSWKHSACCRSIPS